MAKDYLGKGTDVVADPVTGGDTPRRATPATDCLLGAGDAAGGAAAAGVLARGGPGAAAPGDGPPADPAAKGA